MNALNNQDYPERHTAVCQKEGKTAFCRCWKSKTFPYCDGSHRAYNQAHNDHLGPLIIDWTSHAD